MIFLPKLIFIILFVGCNSNNKDKNSLVDFTAEIQLGIENHIEKKSLIGHGFFKLEFEEKELDLKLVKVHTEYLSNLGPQEHFACVDLASTNGFVYDVDFFLSGNPGEMIVTETTVHKINGQPLYLWEQNSDKTWHRVSAENASPEVEEDDPYADYQIPDDLMW